MSLSLSIDSKRKEKLDNLDRITTELIKKLGKNSEGIIKSSADNCLSIPVWKLSSPILSYICGRGFPKGRIIEIYGPESSGKSSLSMKIAADIQSQGGIIGYVDAEHSFDWVYANTLGLSTSTDSFRLIQPDFGEQAFEIIDSYIKGKVFDLIIIDSVAALTPKAELDGNYGDSHMGLQARMMSQAMRKLTSILAESETTIIFINQIRMKIGVMFGSPETVSGGNSLKYYSSIRLDCRKKEILKEGEESKGILINVKNVKNKVAPPFRKGEIELNFKEGFNLHKQYIDFAVSFGIIKKSGSWYSYNDSKVGQGLDNVVNYMKNNSEVYEELCKKVDQFLYEGKNIENCDEDSSNKKKKDDLKQKFKKMKEKIESQSLSSSTTSNSEEEIVNTDNHMDHNNDDEDKPERPSIRTETENEYEGKM